MKPYSRLVEDNDMNTHSEVWPSDINKIPTTTNSWLPAEDQNGYEDSSAYARGFTGIRPKRSLQMELPGAYNGVLIGNPSIPRSLQRVVTSRNRSGVTPGPTLSFHNVDYKVKRRRCNLLGTPEPYSILKGISAIMRPGINAIIGPSGSGKTTLLDILSGKKESNGSGVVLVDGKRLPRNFKFKSGYVVQHDMVTSTLTVKENIAFSAFIRMSADTTTVEREQRVCDVIEKMNLEECADTRIGDDLIRGVSGGERKRTSIGMELVTNPKILFLDEPTTGLDAATALIVMRVLRSISMEDHKIVIMTIHQPRYSIYKLIDQLTLISKGEIVYHGKRTEATNYFKNLEYERDPEDNPADFFLDTIMTNEVTLDMAKKEDEESFHVSSLPDQFKRSRNSKKLNADLEYLYKDKPHVNASDADQTAADANQTYPTSALRQFRGLSMRNLKNLVRHPQAALTLSIIMTILALVVGTIFFRRTDELSGLQDRFGSFFFSILVMDYLNLAAMELFIQQRAVFIHEKESGFYRVSAYFLAKLLCDLLPMTIIPVPLYCAITYWMIGLRHEVTRFLKYMLALMLLNFTVGSLALAIGAAVGKFSIANPIYVMILVISMVFSGFLIGLRNVVVWLRWIQYLSFFKYCINILAVNEFEGQTYCDKAPNNITEQYECIPQFTRNGDEFLEEMGYLDYNVWFNHLGLLLHGIFYLILAYIFLRTLKKR